MAWCAQHITYSSYTVPQTHSRCQSTTPSSSYSHKNNPPASSTITCTWLHFSRFDNLVAFSMIFLVTSSLCAKEQFSLVHLYCDSHIYPNFFLVSVPSLLICLRCFCWLFILYIYVEGMHRQIGRSNIRKRITRQRLGYSIQ